MHANINVNSNKNQKKKNNGIRTCGSCRCNLIGLCRVFHNCRSTAFVDGKDEVNPEIDKEDEDDEEDDNGDNDSIILLVMSRP